MQSALTPPSTLFEKTARWFDRAKAALLGNLPCCQGCSHCCVGVFPVTLLDRQEIQRGLRTLSLEQRLAIQQNAIRQIRILSDSAPRLTENMFIDHWPDRDIDHIVDQFGTLPCPALQVDGSCSLYAFRPLACRSMGIPSETDGVTRGACAIQTAIPLIRLSRTLREEENILAGIEATQLASLRREHHAEGEELLLPFAFPSDNISDPARSVT